MSGDKVPGARKGRGAGSNPPGRFEPRQTEPFDDGWGNLDAPLEPIKTRVGRDLARTVIARNQSPDVPFSQSLNPYQGCEHGCVYCYARPSHAYLGLSPGLDFETRLFSKENAAQRLRKELRQPSYRCDTIALGANTDPYQPTERRLQITRQVLEVLAEHRHPVAIVTKSALIERDLDILGDMARDNLVAVYISVTSTDRALTRKLEPRAAAPQRRLQTIGAVAQAGVPTGVLVAPLIPALTDHELEPILAQSAEAGACMAGYVLLRLPHEVKDLFQEWLQTHAPTKADHVMERLKEARGGQANDPQYGTRMRGTGAYADMLAQRFQLACRRHGLNRQRLVLDTEQFTVPQRSDSQLALF